MKRQAVILGLLACAFLGRVLGQVTVGLLEPDWLSPMQDGYSGLLPYSILLPIQVAILALQARISWDLWHGSGFFTQRYPRFGLGARPVQLRILRGHGDPLGDPHGPLPGTSLVGQRYDSRRFPLGPGPLSLYLEPLSQPIPRRSTC